MRMIFIVLGAMLALPAAAIASPSFGHEPPPHARMTEAQRAAYERLLGRNHGMEVRLARDVGVPAFLRRGALPLAVAASADEEAETAMRFVEENAPFFLLDDPALELLLEDVHVDALGGNHYRFQQQVDGVPVRGAELLAHFDSSGEMYALTAQTVPTPSVNAAPVLNAYDAATIARGLFDSTNVDQEPLLEIHAVAGGWRLVYAVQSVVDTVNRWMTVVDADSGEVLRHFRDHREITVRASGEDLAGRTRTFNAWQERGMYYLIDVTLPAQSGNERPLSGNNAWGDTHVVDLLNTEGDTQRNISSSTADGGWDAAGVSALINSQAAWRYFREAHGRDSIDGRNGSLLSAVHYGEGYDNAFWNGQWMVYGDGGRRFTSLAECTDMVAHEMTHGVIDHSADLLYENQSGALDESLADVFGVLAAGGDWTLGEDCVKVAPGFLRSMANPHAGLAWQPSHMSEYLSRPNTEDGDWGGVHYNSGIPNRAAYLLMEGLSAEGLGKSIGREKAGRLYYHAMTSYLLSGSEFIDLRRALLMAAEYLYPGSDVERAAVIAAFDAVGIIEGGATESRSAASGGITASASRLDFGAVSAGERKSLTLRLKNEGSLNTRVHMAALKGGAFTHAFQGAVLAPGESVEATVSFSGPSLAGDYDGRLEIVADGASEPLIVDLTATVVTGAAEASNARASGGGALHPALLLPIVFAMRRRAR